MKLLKVIISVLLFNNLWASETIESKFNDLIEFKQGYLNIKDILMDDPIRNYFEPRLGYSYRCVEEVASDGSVGEGVASCLDTKTNRKLDLLEVFFKEELFLNPILCSQNKTIKISFEFINNSTIAFAESAEIIIPRGEEFFIIKSVEKTEKDIELFRASCSYVHNSLKDGSNIFYLPNLIMSGENQLRYHTYGEILISGIPSYNEEGYTIYSNAKTVDGVGNIYEGALDDYLNRTGDGRHIYANGDEFIGKFVSDFRIYGKYFYKEEDCVFEGQYVRNLPNGYGSYTCKDGSNYLGSFVDDEYEGAGTFNYSDGDKIVGLFKSGEPVNASWFDAEGRLLYSGGFSNWQVHGNGSRIFRSDEEVPELMSIYTGEFFDDSAAGVGTFTIGEGESYEGIFARISDEETDFIKGKHYIENEYHEGNFKNFGITFGKQSNIDKTYEYEGKFNEDGFWIEGIYRTFDEFGNIVSEEAVERDMDGKITFSQDEARRKKQNFILSKRYALVVGNSNYNQTQDYGNLENPVNDARLIADSLTKAGFEVDASFDLDQDEFEQKIKEFKNKLAISGRNTIALFYFSGHGLQVSGDNYLVPIDAEIDVESDLVEETVSASKILKAMGENYGGTNIFILDACRDNPFERTFARGSNSGLAMMNAPDGSYIGYSTGPGKEAADGTDGNSVFTKSLALHMLEPGLNIEEVFKKTRIQVAKETRNKQIPWSSSSLTIDFYFIPE